MSEETHLLKIGEWIRVPPHILTIVQQLSDEFGGNIAIGQNPIHGWVILHDQGFGIDVAWKEKEHELEL